MTIDEIEKFAKENKARISTTLFDTDNDRKSNHGMGTLWINEIVVQSRHRHKGIGTKIIRLLQEYAKTEKLNIRLLACNCYGTDLEILYRFYYNLGFRYDRSGKKDESSMYMIWEY